LSHERRRKSHKEELEEARMGMEKREAGSEKRGEAAALVRSQPVGQG